MSQKVKKMNVKVADWMLESNEKNNEMKTRRNKYILRAVLSLLAGGAFSCASFFAYSLQFLFILSLIGTCVSLAIFTNSLYNANKVNKELKTEKEIAKNIEIQKVEGVPQEEISAISPEKEMSVTPAVKDDFLKS